jgi:hypothetical protein
MQALNRFVTDADFGARQTLYAVSQDLPGDSFVGPPLRLHRADRPRPPQPAGARRKEGRGALGAIRAAHRYQIRIVTCPCATLCARNGEGGI